MSTQPFQTQYPYVPNYAMYSRAPEGWHDEPFEYVFTFQQSFGAPITTTAQATILNQPMQLDPDADFFMRGLAVLVDSAQTEEGAFPIVMAMRLRNAFNRALDSGFIPMPAYAAGPNLTGTPSVTDPWQATPWFPEMYFPANSAMWGDFQALAIGGTYYSFHVYLQGIKRFKNEACKPGEAASTAVKAQ